MKKTNSEREIALLKKLFNNQENQGQEDAPAVPRRSIVLGHVVRSAKYGKGYVAKIEDDAVKVRFWKYGYKRFVAIDGKFAFEVLDEIRSIKPRRSRYCEHREIRELCLICAELSVSDIEEWNKKRTTEQRIWRSGWRVRISTNDCSLVSHSTKKIRDVQISDWYRCQECGATHEFHATKGKVEKCPQCHGSLTSIAEPFQDNQFDWKVGGGAESRNYVDAAPLKRTPATEITIIAKNLFTDPNSRFGTGGIGYLRIPLDAPRAARRADTPEWLDRRADFIRTLRAGRAARAEQILYSFYFEDRTDTQIAETLGWAKDSVKKERATLVHQGNEFFRSLAANHPPRPAIYGGEQNLFNARPSLEKYPPRPAIYERNQTVNPPKARPVFPTVLVAVCSPEPGLLRLYPVFEVDGEHFAKTNGHYTPVTKLDGFMREELCRPCDRKSQCSHQELCSELAAD